MAFWHGTEVMTEVVEMVYGFGLVTWFLQARESER